jgi:hypothetical protein
LRFYKCVISHRCGSLALSSFLFLHGREKIVQKGGGQGGSEGEGEGEEEEGKAKKGEREREGDRREGDRCQASKRVYMSLP